VSNKPLQQQYEPLTDNHKEVLSEQIRLLYKQTWSMLAVNMLVGAALLVGLWSTVATQTLTLWYSYLLLVFALRVVIYYSYKKYANSDNLGFFCRLFMVGVFFSGLAWASASVLFFQPEQIENQLADFSRQCDTLNFEGVWAKLTVD